MLPSYWMEPYIQNVIHTSSIMFIKSNFSLFFYLNFIVIVLFLLHLYIEMKQDNKQRAARFTATLMLNKGSGKLPDPQTDWKNSPNLITLYSFLINSIPQLSLAHPNNIIYIFNPLKSTSTINPGSILICFTNIAMYHGKYKTSSSISIFPAQKTIPRFIFHCFSFKQ